MSRVQFVEINFIDPILKDRYGAPLTATPGAAAVDLRACPETPPGNPIALWPGHEYTWSAGFRMSMPHDLAALIIPRSGQGWKGINLANSTGLIDSDYQGEIKIKLVNRGSAPYRIEPYDRIAQMIFINPLQVAWVQVDEFTNLTERGLGGFGSTGKT